jgi:hypothetical protein
MHILTDEDAVAYTDKLIERVAKAITCVRLFHPDASVDALMQILFIVNGEGWMGATDMARVRILAKSLDSKDPS